jgi:hypothetical protein
MAFPTNESISADVTGWPLTASAMNRANRTGIRLFRQRQVLFMIQRDSFFHIL